MVLRVDVVASALDAVYGRAPAIAWSALSPQGRQLDQELVEELATEDALTLLSARFEGFDQRILDNLCTDVVSIGPYVLSGGEIPALAVVDAIARRLPGALTEGSGEVESFSAALDGGTRVSAHTRGRPSSAVGSPRDPGSPGPRQDPRAWRRELREERLMSDTEDASLRPPGPPELERTGQHDADWRWPPSKRADRRLLRARPFSCRSASREHDITAPQHDTTTARSRHRASPEADEIAVDWDRSTIAGSQSAIVLAIKAWVVNPRTGSPRRMEPTLHCRRPRGTARRGSPDRVLANRFIYHFRDPAAGRRHRLRDPAGGEAEVRSGRNLRKRIIGLPTSAVRCACGGARVRLRRREAASTSRTSRTTAAT
jgi:tRNA (guanine37-N1)-methyltransferase